GASRGVQFSRSPGAHQAANGIASSGRARKAGYTRASCASLRAILIMSRLSSEALLAQTAHREQWALPTRPWVMAQTWEHLLFAHWPISVDALRSLIPPDLSIDTFDGQAWLGVVPFEMRNVHFRAVPPMPLLSAFAELNVRTYVTHNGKPGVWFFSLDAANFPAVQFARRGYHLPYFMATMHVQISGDT